MNQKTLSLGLITLGLLVLLVCVLADPLGLGGKPGFGIKQTIGSVAGFAIALAGWLMKRRGAASH